MKDNIGSSPLLLRAILLIVLFVQVQLLSEQIFSSGDYNNDIIPKTFALSQIGLSRTRQLSPTVKKESNFRNQIRNRPSNLAFGKRGNPLLSLSAARSTFAIVNSTEPKVKKGSKRVNVQVRSLMSILEDRYDLTILSSADNITNKEKATEWKKTRNYLYRASYSYQEKRDGDNGDTVNVLTFSQQVVSVLDFLDDRLALPPHVAKRIVQESPRILRKPVDSFLIPTADFLLKLWGADLFLEAVERNPSLLLTSGIGYTTNRRKKTVAANDVVPTQLENDESAYDNDSSARLDQNVEEILLKRTGLSSRAVKQLKKSTPHVFGYSLWKVQSVLKFLDRIVQEKQVIAKITPTAQTETETEMGTETSVEAESKAKQILGKIIFAYPHLLNLSVESNLKPRVEFLAKSCDLSPAELATVVKKTNGLVLALSVEKNLQPTIEFLLKEIFCGDEKDKGDPRTMLRKCILKHPQLLGLSIANLKSKVDYFRSIGPLLASQIAKRCPNIYSLNLEHNIVPTIHFLAKIWGLSGEGGLSNDDGKNKELSAMLYEHPNTITLSVEANMQPTMMFYNKTGYTVLNEDWELIVSKNSDSRSRSRSRSRSPELKNADASRRIRGRYISASLYNRLLPRWHFCLSRTAEEKSSEHKTATASSKTETSSVTEALRMPSESSSTSSSTPSHSTSSSSSSSAASLAHTPSLQILVMGDDRTFCEAMGFELDTFLNFKKEAIPRLKFSSQFDTWLKTGKPIDL